MKSKPRVLVVDDDPFMLKVLEDLLGKAGYRVACASNTVGAGYLMKDFSPQLIVLDILLPGSLSGDLACDSLRRQCPGVKIVFYSGLDEKQLEELAKRQQADAALAKGGRIDQLLATIKRLLPAGEDA